MRCSYPMIELCMVLVQDQYRELEEERRQVTELISKSIDIQRKAADSLRYADKRLKEAALTIQISDAQEQFGQLMHARVLFYPAMFMRQNRLADVSARARDIGFQVADLVQQGIIDYIKKGCAK